MTAPAVTGTAVHFPLEWAELPSPRGLMACVCMGESVSKRMQGYWLGARATQLIPRYRNINNSTEINWEPLERRLVSSYEVKWFIYLRFQCGNVFYEAVDVHCCFLSKERQEYLRKKCGWCMHQYMIDASPPWPGQAFTLSQHSSHHDCVPLEV